MALGSTAAPLTDVERASLGPVVPERAVEFALGRQQLRAALASLGCPAGDLPRGPDGAPVLPDGFVASLTHAGHASGLLTAAAAARRSDIASLGIDAEETAAVAPKLWPVFLNERELAGLLTSPVPTRFARAGELWCAKEAVAKARRLAVDFQSIDVVFAGLDAIDFVATVGAHVVQGRAGSWRGMSFAAVAEAA